MLYGGQQKTAAKFLPQPFTFCSETRQEFRCAYEITESLDDFRYPRTKL